jgi:hypothetical protein
MGFTSGFVPPPLVELGRNDTGRRKRRSGSGREDRLNVNRGGVEYVNWEIVR